MVFLRVQNDTKNVKIFFLWKTFQNMTKKAVAFTILE